ncbi:hypothetical protein [Thalassotalea sediminis]|uniref:hypothetical protein n=1 Tax=Thalassotalea sediminis TaxID=1759089 RepID=UPI0025734F1A|nr:hypothetical protein [Thalassotalea sediminis]
MKTIKKLSVAIAASLITTASFANWHSDLTLQETKTLSLNGASLSEMHLDVGSGSLLMTGSNTNDINVIAHIYQEEAHSEYLLSLSERGDKAVLKAENQHNDENTRIDLEVQLPSRFNVNIEDGSGSITLKNVKSADIKDGSGSLTVSKVAGNLTIVDGSGSITVEDIQGLLNIDDGSGSISVESVQGSVNIEDGSGSINIINVDRGVTISDGSGSITVNNAESFTLLDDGSGSVNISNVKGNVNMNGNHRLK